MTTAMSKLTVLSRALSAPLCPFNPEKKRGKIALCSFNSLAFSKQQDNSYSDCDDYEHC